MSQFTLSQIEKDTAKGEEICEYIHHLLELAEIQNLEQTLQNMLALNNGVSCLEGKSGILNTQKSLFDETVGFLENSLATFFFVSGDFERGVQHGMAAIEFGVDASISYIIAHEKECEQKGIPLPNTATHLHSIASNSQNALYGNMPANLAFGHLLGRHGLSIDYTEVLEWIRRDREVGTKDSFLQNLVPILEHLNEKIDENLRAVLAYFYDDYYCSLLKPIRLENLLTLDLARVAIEEPVKIEVGTADFSLSAHRLTNALLDRAVSPQQRTIYKTNKQQWHDFKDAAQSLLTNLQSFPVEVQRNVAFELDFSISGGIAKIIKRRNWQT